MSNLRTSGTAASRLSEVSELILPGRSAFTDIHESGSYTSTERPGIQHFALNETERSIIQRWGTVALENLYQLGERLEKEPALLHALGRIGRRDSPQAIQLLAADLPDLLMSAHVLDSALGGAVASTFYQGLPQTGSDMAAAALRLRRFGPGDLSIAISTEKQFTSDAAPSPVYTLLTASQIKLFGDAQLTAYRSRLATQPGGKGILRTLDNNPGNSTNQHLTRIITVQTLEQLRALGAPALRMLRLQAAPFINSQWQTESLDHMTSHRITGLTDSEGRRFGLPHQLVQKVSAAHHQAWLEARSMLENTAAPSASTQGTPSYIRGSDRVLYNQNLNNIAALTLATQISALPDSLFNRLTEIATSTDSEIDAYTLPAFKSPAAAPSETPIAQTSILARRLQFPEILPRVEQLRGLIDNAQLEHDYQIATPVFDRIDRLPGSIHSETYHELIQHLRTLQRHRALYTEQLKLGMLSIPVHTLADEILDGDLHVADAPEVIREFCSERFRSRIQECQEQYERTRLQKGYWDETAAAEGFQGTMLLTPESLSARFPEIDSLIWQNTATLERMPLTGYSAGEQARGRLMPGDYSLEYFENLLRDGNYVLYRPKAAEAGSGLDGIFVYYRLGNFPESIKGLKDTLSAVDDVAYESLFLTAQDRTKGTYMMLLRGMGARQALAGARYSFGTVNETNPHHFELLQAVDHYPLHGAPIVLDALGQKFTPMLWELP